VSGIVPGKAKKGKEEAKIKQKVPRVLSSGEQVFPAPFKAHRIR